MFCYIVIIDNRIIHTNIFLKITYLSGRYWWDECDFHDGENNSLRGDIMQFYGKKYLIYTRYCDWRPNLLQYVCVSIIILLF